MICIYHSRDLDGWMSAAIVKLKFPEVELIGWDYGKPIPALDAEKHDALVMVDIAFPSEIMSQLNDPFDFVWIDHHLSAIRDNKWTEEHGFGKGLRRMDFAACELTWMYFFPDKPMPEIVRLLGRYDCFGHKGTPEEKYVLEFQYGARQWFTSPEGCYERLVKEQDKIGFTDFTIALHGQGASIYAYLCTEAKQTYAKKFDLKLDGHLFACVNQERFNPVNFGIDYHKDGYEGFACFWYQNKKWTYSLYNDNKQLDVSEVCKKRGGGGHAGASGFTTLIPILDEN